MASKRKVTVTIDEDLVEQLEQRAALQTACACEHVEVELATEHRCQ